MVRVLSAIVRAKSSYDNPKIYTEIGIEIGKTYTDFGLPVDMALDRLKLSKYQKLLVLDGVCQWLILHRRNSQASEKAIERQRQVNTNMLERFIKSGESGAY